MTDKEFTDIAPELRRLALQKGSRYALSTDSADDIAQDTMLKLWAIRRNVRSGTHARGLAVQIAAHLAVDLLRHRRTMPTADELTDNIGGEADSPEARLEAKSNDEWLERQLQRLPTMEYQVLHLRQVEQKEKEEIAAILGITPQSVATLLSRARRKLMERIRKR